MFFANQEFHTTKLLLFLLRGFFALQLLYRPSSLPLSNAIACTVQEVHGFTTVAELEKFLLEHGEHVVDVLGLEVDRMERAIKVHMHVHWWWW